MYKSILGVLMGCCLLTACGTNTHYSRVRRGIYHPQVFDDRVDAAVLVVYDRFLPETLEFTDDNLSEANRLVVETADGFAVAAADALSTLFTRVDAGEYRLAAHYDWVAEVHVDVSEKAPTVFSVYNQLDTNVALTLKVKVLLRRPGSRAPGITASATRSHPLRYRRWHSSWLSPEKWVPFPFRLRASGNERRRLLEQDMVACLKEIMYEFYDKRARFFEPTADLPRAEAQNYVK